MSLYAEGTSTSESKSKVEIDELLRKWKSTNVAVGEGAAGAVVYFGIGQWQVKFEVPMPSLGDAEKALKGKRSYHYPTTVQKTAWVEQERRRRWRALLLTVKAKLVSVENAIETFEQAFLAHLVIEGGQTVGQRVLPAIAETYKSGRVPNGGLLGAGA